MSGDLNQSASASAEANAVKLSGNTVNVNLSSVGASDGLGALARIVRLVNPACYERREAEAREIRVESVISAAKRIYDEFPNMSESRAVMEAMGYRMTNEQADNVIEVLKEAQGNLDAQNKDAKGLLPEARDAILEGSKTAYDDTVRSMWARLVAGESVEPGSFSKRTTSILSDMSRDEALAFQHLCGVCIGGTLRNGCRQDATYPFGLPKELAPNTDELEGLRAIGLTSLSGHNGILITSSILIGSSPTALRVGSNDYVVISDSNVSLSVAGNPLTSYGMELSSLCPLGTFDGFEDYVVGNLKERGARVMRVIDWQDVDRFEAVEV